MEPKKPFFGRITDPEKFIGENLINKVGIAILVIGIGYFVKYAFAHDWVNEAARIAIGLGIGGVLIGIGHFLRARYRAFSSVLAGGGLAVGYTTVYIGYQLYGLFSPEAAFSTMVGLTGLAVGLSLWYDRQELAIIALAGGFATPILASTGDPNFTALFTYIALLNTGMLVVSYFKRWRGINTIAYVGTLLFMIVGRFDFLMLSNHPEEARTLMLFGTLFFVQFMLSSLLHNLVNANKFKAMEMIVIASSTFFYYVLGCGALLPLVDSFDPSGAFTAAMGAFYLGLSAWFSQRQNTDKNLLLLFIGLAVTFISLVPLVELNGHHITLFWAAEAILLLWMWKRTGMVVFKFAAPTMGGLGLASLLLLWVDVYDKYAAMVPILNPAYLTGMGFVIALIVGLYIVLRGEDRSKLSAVLRTTRETLVISAIALFYVVNLLELLHQMHHRIDVAEARSVIVAGFHLLIGFGFMVYARIRNNIDLLDIGVVGTILSVIVVWFMHYNAHVELRYGLLAGESAHAIGFYLHYLNLGFVLSLIGLSISHIPHIKVKSREAGIAFFWGLTVSLVFLFSTELESLALLVFGDGANTGYVLQQTRKIGFPILWGLLSFGLMFIGLRQRDRNLRIIGLCLFALTLVKLFVFDLRGISEPGKIAAFIALGVLMLTISFLYQKLKAFLIEGELVDTGEELPQASGE